MAELRGPVDHLDPRLKTFRRADWEQPGDGRFDPLHRWKAARAKWLARHPNSLALGNKLEQMRTEMQAQFTPEHYPTGATEWTGTPWKNKEED